MPATLVATHPAESSTRRRPGHRTVVLVPRMFSLFELGIAIEAFAVPPGDRTPHWYDVVVCSARPGAVPTMGGLFCASIPHGLAELATAETIIVPQADETAFPADDDVLEAVADAHARGARLLSMWTGVFVLAAAGVLDGRPAAVHWQHAGRFAVLYPQVRVNPRVLYIDDGSIITSAGTASTIDATLHVIRKDHGAGVAAYISRAMVLAPHRDGSQAQYLQTPLPESPSSPDGIAVAMEFALRNLHRDLGLDDLARAAFMSTRHFSRRFRQVTGTSPARWVTNQKLARAQALLEETNHSIERVASASGFASAVTFRQRFAQSLDMSPASYRRAYREALDPRTG